MESLHVRFGRSCNLYDPTGLVAQSGEGGTGNEGAGGTRNGLGEQLPIIDDAPPNPILEQKVSQVIGLGDMSYSVAGMTNGYQALLDLSNGANLDSAPCQRILGRLFSNNFVTGIANPVAQIRRLADTILHQGLLFDGGSSNTTFSPVNFGALRPGDKPSNNGMVSGYFDTNPDVVGLGQSTGNAIWMRSAYTVGRLQAEDTVLHEVLHKIAAPFSVDGIPDLALGENCFRNPL